MSAHIIPIRDPELDNVPDEIMDGVIKFAIAIRGVPLGQVLEPCRQEALRQFRRERLVMIKARVEYNTKPLPDKEADSYQREREDEQQFGWAAE